MQCISRLHNSHVFPLSWPMFAKTSINVIDRVLIRACIKDEHPFINVQGIRLRIQLVPSKLPAGAKFLHERIAFEPRKSPAKKAELIKKAKKVKA